MENREDGVWFRRRAAGVVLGQVREQVGDGATTAATQIVTIELEDGRREFTGLAEKAAGNDDAGLRLRPGQVGAREDAIQPQPRSGDRLRRGSGDP